MSTTTRDLIEKRAKAHAATAAIANRPADPSTGMRSAADAAAWDLGQDLLRLIATLDDDPDAIGQQVGGTPDA